MYPLLPESPADLVPLPQIEGPKLNPFDFHGPQKIEFLESLGQGSHSHVFKVRIHEKIYALKLFRFVYDQDWYGPPSWSKSKLEVLNVLAPYSEPFNAECRAFGRLQESGHTELAVECFGYLLLDDEHEQLMMNKFEDLKLDFNGNLDNPAEIPRITGSPTTRQKLREWLDSPERWEWDMRGRFRDKDGKLPPIRGIVKEFGQQPKLDSKLTRKMHNDVVHLHQLGLFSLDMDIRQYINGKVADFSTVFTTPHFLTNPEIISPIPSSALDTVEYQIFSLVLCDFWSLDEMVDDWNWSQKIPPKNHVKLHSFIYSLVRNDRYNLRSKPHRERVYTLVDPRSYDWKASADVVEDKRQSIGKAEGSRKKPSQGVSKVRRRLSRKPPRWYFNTTPKANAKLQRPLTPHFCLQWDIIDGNLVPWKTRYDNRPKDGIYKVPKERDFL